MQKWWRIRSEVVCKDIDKLNFFIGFKWGEKCTISWVLVGWRCYGWLVKAVTAKTSCSDYFNRSLSHWEAEMIFSTSAKTSSGDFVASSWWTRFNFSNCLENWLKEEEKQFSPPPYDRHCCFFIGDKSFAQTLLIVISSSTTCCAPAQASVGGKSLVLQNHVCSSPSGRWAGLGNTRALPWIEWMQ